MNFGGGEEDPKRKTRKEVFEEIIQKKKAFDAAKQDMKDINT